MRRSARVLFWLIVFLTLVSVWINFPLGQDKVFQFLRIDKHLAFREGLDLKGGSSMTYRADMKNIPSDQKPNALNSAKTIIEKRVNLFGVSEPVINTAIINGDYRI
ncbi:MAG: hypothetical protein HYU48_01885, partial [Candidatus Levybacteria bacterium]|nr:hypothetical protein [Candidatus Levybacteria bacterium]